MTERLPLPLSTAQRGMWVGQQIAPAGAIFNIAEAIELHGAIDPTTLREALRRVTQEMETLRTRIVQQSGLPRQIVLPAFEDEIALRDVSGDANPRDAALDWMMAELSEPFDFETSPLWVSAVIRVSDAHWFWYHRAHHIILDGFSGGMVVQRVAELYSALRQDRAPADVAYGTLGSLIETEAAYRASERCAKDRAYWMARMANLPEPATLAVRDAPPIGGLRRATAFLSQAVVDRLRERIKGLNVSLPQALIALVAAYYQRMTGVDDLVFGLPVTARASGVMRRAPGMVANAVPIRLSFTDATTAESLFAQTARAVREALRHQQYRYEDLRRDLGLLNQGRQIARLSINIEPFDYELTFDGVRATPHNLSNSQMEDLTVFVYDRSDGNGLRVDLDANPGLYSVADLEAHKRRLCRLIDIVTDRIDAPLADLDILDQTERLLLSVGWNNTADPTPVADVPTLFARQAAAMPDRTAILFDRHADRTLSYYEVDRLSLTLARRLAVQEIGRGDVVAVCLPRSDLLPVALLGIMRAGAAYLPLDPDGPADRLSLMLDDASPACVLTTRAYRARFDEVGITCLFLDDAQHADPGCDPGPVALPQADPAATAYILFTSGSTGRPKGVEISHANLANFVAGMIDLLRPSRFDRLLSVTTVIFDIAGLEFFLPLCVGASLVIADGETVRDPAALGRLVARHAISLLQATPSFWRMLLTDRSISLDTVHALVGGEALSAELAERLLARTRAVTNLYGPTETTIWSTAMRLTANDIAPPPIGRPIRNTTIRILDQRRRPVPVGVTGTMHIGGAGVARGYLNQKALTADRFIADPFGRPGDRLYNTGDLARWRTDGVLEYCGRADQQLKIRGHRIEPGEIETHLARHDDVLEAAVVARPDPTGEPALVAYVVASETGAVDAAILRRHLAERIPGYMMPALILFLDAMPQTANGKLDRKALPPPSWDRASLDRRAPTPPRTEIERRLVVIWQDILNRQDIGIHDNFFELGGDSLSGADLIVTVSTAFSQEIPFSLLFRTSTIAGLAALLEGGTGGGMLDMLLPLKMDGDAAPLFCVHPVIGLGWPYAALLRHLPPGRPLYALQAASLRGADRQPDSIEQMAAQYLAEIRRVQPHGPYHLLGWSLGGLVAHAMAAQLQDAGETVARLVLLDSYPFAAAHPDRALSIERQIELALAFLGLRPDDADYPRDMTALADYLCHAYDLMGQPVVQAVLRTESDLMTTLGRTVQHNLSLAQRYVPRKIDAETMFCNAAAGRTERMHEILRYSAEVWRPLVRSLVVHDIDCHHQDILSAEPARHVGTLLRGCLVDGNATHVMVESGD